MEAFTAIIGFSEPGLRLGTDDFVLKATVVTIILLSVVGVIGLIIAYLDRECLSPPQICASYLFQKCLLRNWVTLPRKRCIGFGWA